MSTTTTGKTRRKCDYCGRRGEDVSMHSGSWECWPCWNYRKLDQPAADHWAKVAKGFLSNVDMYDLTKYFKACGVDQDQAITMLSGARKLEIHSRYLAENGPQHRWSDEVAAHHENELRTWGYA